MPYISLYTDGSCDPNPGRMGIGGVLLWNGHVKKYSLGIGEGTNNIAELKAIEHGLSLIKNKTIPVLVISDSQYAIKVLDGTWKPSKNIPLVASIKSDLTTFADISFTWVRGHNGNKYNEMADHLAQRGMSE